MLLTNLKIFISVSICIASVNTAAQDIQIPKDFNLQEPSKLTVNGVDGVWFDLETSKLVLEDVKAMQHAFRLLEIAEQKTALYETQVQLLNEAYTIKNSNYLAQKDLLKIQHERAVSAEEKLGAWYRNPVLWFTVGLIIGAGATSIVVIASR